MRSTNKITKRIFSPDRDAFVSSLVIFVILMMLWWQSSQWYQDQLIFKQRAQVAEDVSLRGSALTEAINRRFSLLQSLQAFVRTESGEEDFNAKFQVFAADLYSSTTGLTNIAAAPGGAIQFIYPPEGNEALLGLDLLQESSAEIVDDVQLAMESNEIILGFPLDYAQETLGIAARKAVYLQDGTLWGLISIVIDIPTLLEDAGLDEETAELSFQLVDSSNTLIYRIGKTTERNGVSYRLALPGGETWTITGYPQEDWADLVRPGLLPIQISGLLIVILFAILVYVSVNRQMRLTRAVQERTFEIAQINSTLEERVIARTRELTTLLEVSQKVATSPDIQPLLSLILDRLESIVPCKAVVIFMNEDNRFLSLLTYRGPLSSGEMPNRWDLEEADHYRAVIQNRQSFIIPDVREDTQFARSWRGTAEQHLGAIPEYVKGWMAVPLLIKKRVIGLLVFHHHEANYYSEEHANLAAAFAQQAALAIENTRLYEQAQQAAVLRERQRIARDLHDSVSQALYSVALGARAAQKIAHKIPGEDPRSQISEPIEHILTMAEAGLAEMRALIFELRPETLENEGLVSALTKQATAIQTRHNLTVRMSLCEEPDISLDLKLLLYRVAQEGLHNVVKHARAGTIDLVLECPEGEIRLTIRDDGCGFDPSVPPKGLGLRSMAERVEQVSGQLLINSEPDTGTTISVILPNPPASFID